MFDVSLRRAGKDRWKSRELGWRGYLKTEKGILFEDRITKTLDMVPKLGKDAKYLDIGCGDGFLTGRYTKGIETENVYGSDFLDLREAESNKINAVCIDLNNIKFLPFKDSLFDVITCIETLEHVLDTDALILEIHRVLKKGRVAIISVPRIDSLLSISQLALGYQPQAIECSIRKRYGVINKESRISGHVSNFTKRALLEMLNQHGFEIVDYNESGIYSGWKLTQKARGVKAGFVPNLILKIFSWIPFKRDVCIVKVRKFE